jgi:hypothetical protein
MSLRKNGRYLHASCECCTLDERDAIIDALRRLVEQGWQIDLTYSFVDQLAPRRVTLGARVDVFDQPPEQAGDRITPRRPRPRNVYTSTAKLAVVAAAGGLSEGEAKMWIVACATCGEQFAPKRSNALYCSAACKQTAYRQRRLAA